MFADDNSIENIQQLFLEFKKYLELQKKYTQLEVAEKLTILLSTLILVYAGLYIRPDSGRTHGKFRHDKLFPHLIDCTDCHIPQKNHY